jgi:hypothetical protein
LKSGSLSLLEPSGPVQVCTEIALLKFYIQVCQNLNVKLRCQKVKGLTAWNRVLLQKLIVPQVFKILTRVTRNPKVLHRVYKSPPINPLLSQELREVKSRVSLLFTAALRKSTPKVVFFLNLFCDHITH